MKIDSYSYHLPTTALCAEVSPPDDGPFKKTAQITIFDLETINLDQSLCLMSFWVQGSKSHYLEAFVYILKQYFILISQNLPYQGGTTRLIKFLPCAKNFFLRLTEDSFVMCNLKVTKNNRKTYHNMHFDKKLPKKILSTYFRLYPHLQVSTSTTKN